MLSDFGHLFQRDSNSTKTEYSEAKDKISATDAIHGVEIWRVPMWFSK